MTIFWTYVCRRSELFNTYLSSVTIPNSHPPWYCVELLLHFLCGELFCKTNWVLFCNLQQYLTAFFVWIVFYNAHLNNCFVFINQLHQTNLENVLLGSNTMNLQENKICTTFSPMSLAMLTKNRVHGKKILLFSNINTNTWHKISMKGAARAMGGITSMCDDLCRRRLQKVEEGDVEKVSSASSS